MDRRLEAVIKTPAVAAACCAIMVTSMEAVNRSNTRMFDVLRGIARPLVVDMHYILNEEREVSHQEVLRESYPKFAPPVVVPVAGTQVTWK